MRNTSRDSGPKRDLDLYRRQGWHLGCLPRGAEYHMSRICTVRRGLGHRVGLAASSQAGYTLTGPASRATAEAPALVPSSSLMAAGKGKDKG